MGMTAIELNGWTIGVVVRPCGETLQPDLNIHRLPTGNTGHQTGRAGSKV